jgi:glycosyltransferase involved in cell wall biosynthesis
VRSALGQTFDDFELWIWDNASEDSAAEFVASLKDPRIRYQRRAADVGLAANWIGAMEASKGKYCAVLGDDDLWEPTFLERLVAPLDADDAVDIAFCDHWMVDPRGVVMAAESEAHSHGYGRAALSPGLHRPFRSLVLRDQAILINAALVRRDRLSLAGALDARAGRVLDYYILGKLAGLGGGAFYVNERLYRYRRHDGTMTVRQPVQIWRDMQWVCADLHRETAVGYVQAVRRKWAQAIVSEGVAAWRAQGGMDSGACLARALWRVPARVRTQVATLVLMEGLRRAVRARSTDGPGLRGVVSANP